MGSKSHLAFPPDLRLKALCEARCFAVKEPVHYRAAGRRDHHVKSDADYALHLPAHIFHQLEDEFDACFSQ